MSLSPQPKGKTSTALSADPAVIAQTQETANNARILLQGLPIKQQEVIRLKIDHGLSYREIAEITGLTVSNVGYLLHQGFQTLRTKLTAQRVD